MFDLPEHWWIPVNKNHDGPVYEDGPAFDHFCCACGDHDCNKAAPLRSD